jgi:hypothetical protein
MIIDGGRVSTVELETIPSTFAELKSALGNTFEGKKVVLKAGNSLTEMLNDEANVPSVAEGQKLFVNVYPRDTKSGN